MPQFVPHLHGGRRPPGTDMGHPADASRDRGPDLSVHGGRRRGQPNPMGSHAARLDRHLLQPSHGNTARLRLRRLKSQLTCKYGCRVVKSSSRQNSLGHLVEKTEPPKLLNICDYVVYDKKIYFLRIALRECRLVKNQKLDTKSLCPALSGRLVNLHASVKGGAQTALEKNVRMLSHT